MQTGRGESKRGVRSHYRFSVSRMEFFFTRILLVGRGEEGSGNSLLGSLWISGGTDGCGFLEYNIKKKKVRKICT